MDIPAEDTESPMTVAGLRRRARARLMLPDLEEARAAGGAPSDFDLDPTARADFPLPQSLKPAAVLVPVIARATPAVLFTQRTEELAAHAGQISFPGGKIDAGDAGPLAAALREAEEEIGLSPALVEPLGCLDTYRTVTGYAIRPIVALIDPAFRPVPNPREVAHVFEAPLPYLMDARNLERHSRLYRGKERRFYAIPFENHYIWGATAGILKNMHERLFRL